MGRKAKDVLKELEKNIKQAAKQAAKETAEELTYQVQVAYRNAIDLFYEDKVFFDHYENPENRGTPVFYNTPRRYKRTFSTYEASSGFELTDSIGSGRDISNYVNIYHKGDEMGYFGGITVSEHNIKGNPYKISKSYVFERTFKYGIHGVCRADQRLFNKRRSSNKEQFWYLRKQVKRSNEVHYYSYGDNNIQQRMKRFPNITSPSPYEVMNKSFKKITTKKNISSVFGGIMDYYMSKIR